jgi:hypothetical protein
MVRFCKLVARKGDEVEVCVLAWVSRNGEQDVRKKGPGSVGMVNRVCERKGLGQ